MLYHKGNENCKKINTDHLIVLCEVGEDYRLFYEDLERIIQSKNNKNFVRKMYRTMQGEFSIGTRKYQSFIEKHQRTIEIMKQYNCLSELILFRYDANGKKRKDFTEDYFYQYIQEHKEYIENIKAVALKIKEIGVEEIIFGEDLDFTDTEYKLDNFCGIRFAFLENIEVCPTYLSSPIKYVTKDSCYRLNLSLEGIGDKRTIDRYYGNIELNSLIFDPNRLPDEITVESTALVIYELAKKKKEAYVAIRNSVDFSVSTSDLRNELERLKSIVLRIDKVKDNQELNLLFDQMQNILEQLQLFGVNFENQVIDSHTSISRETMKREKKLYVDGRQWSNIDID